MSERLSLGLLDELEAESIQIIREVAAEGERPVMMYSIGKDSSVMLHLARKAFHPAPIPFPLLHVDTEFKFPEMIEFRNRMAVEIGFDLRVYTNRQAIDSGANPWEMGTVRCCGFLKTQALLESLKLGSYDLVIGGARREEERSRAKERVFSFRDIHGQWDPRRQRPEFWQLYNTRMHPGESMRVFPLSNWTELDVWRYIAREGIAVVPLYFAAEREVVERNGQLIPVGKDTPLLAGETSVQRLCRFRTLGCYPCTGAVASSAVTVEEIIAELEQARLSERTTRIIDHDQDGSMERKKREGYF
ncbi:sulfate adenylyltransferase subunit CysD [Geobacter pelophilus]|uniref:Sulfate adenylyltransferase subunit 2 n=1 Tax=Geoanaerobacter pelophilus TaxID=60036 RepID=A0AAW4KXN6_9BACT|nr:sulfate adenylyltransferase subunit CysD [Geoanaerobacter pelophilus]MBT0663393.1 sulfate adenylyltransferase subunit CysD [Geoanaerobacter pelophilus]